MNEPYEIRTELFSGPLEKLLELIEGRKMEITRVNLAEVTADFVIYVQRLGVIEPRLLADFIAVAAKLILIKSHALLPSLPIAEEEEHDIADLEHRLRMYRECKQAERLLVAKWGKNPLFMRPFYSGLTHTFCVSEEIAPRELERAILPLIEELSTFIEKYERAEISLVNLEEKIAELVARVDKTARTSFNELTKGKKKGEIIVLFLALLHLVRSRSLSGEQGDAFGDIIMEKC